MYLRGIIISLIWIVPGVVLGQQGTTQVREDLAEIFATYGLEEFRERASEEYPLDAAVILGKPALIFSARNLESVRLRIVAGAHNSLDVVDDSGTTAVMHALMAGRVENAKLLHELGASLEGINDQGYSVRVLAEEAGLMDFGPEYPVPLSGSTIDADDSNRLLLLAAEAGDIQLIDWAIKLGADLSAKADNGLQAAHLAALGGHKEAFDLILSHEAAPSQWATIRSTSKDETVLTVADFIIAGEGGGDHERAKGMLVRARQIPSLAKQVSENVDQYRQAMISVGYSEDIVKTLFGTGKTNADEQAVGSVERSSTETDPAGIAQRVPEQVLLIDAERQIRAFQELLTENRCDPKGVDGSYGPGTASAVRRYNQRKPDTCQPLHNLPEIFRDTPTKEFHELLKANISRLNDCTVEACLDKRASMRSSDTSKLISKSRDEILASWQRFCQTRNKRCIWIAYRERCTTCGQRMEQYLSNIFKVRTVSSAYPDLGAVAGCIGYREDIGGSREIADIVQESLGEGYYVGDNCSASGFSILVHFR